MTHETDLGYSMKNNPDLKTEEEKRWMLFLGSLALSTVVPIGFISLMVA